VNITKYFSGDQNKTKDLAGSCTLLGRGEIYTGFWWGTLREREHMVVPAFYERIINIIVILFQELERGAWTGERWLWRGSVCGNF